MANCTDSNNKVTLLDSPCICCFPPDFGSVNTTIDPTSEDKLHTRRIDNLNEYYFQEFILQKEKRQLNKELFINYIDSPKDQLITAEKYTYTNKFTGEQIHGTKYTGFKPKKLKICLTCASLPDLGSKLRTILKYKSM